MSGSMPFDILFIDLLAISAAIGILYFIMKYPRPFGGDTSVIYEAFATGAVLFSMVLMLHVTNQFIEIMPPLAAARLFSLGMSISMLLFFIGIKRFAETS